MSDQTSNRLIAFQNLIPHLKFVLKFIFLNTYLRGFTVIFYILFIFGIIHFFKNSSTRFKLLFIAISCWLFIELHKLSMIFLPTRYLISLFFPMSLIIALVLYEMLIYKGNYKHLLILKSCSFLILSYLMIMNGINYSSSLKNRSYSILEINKYLSRYNFHEQPIIGACAPSLSWNSNAISYPIWKGYFNDTNVIEQYKPAIIITEIGEQDSNGAFLSQKIEVDN